MIISTFHLLMPIIHGISCKISPQEERTYANGVHITDKASALQINFHSFLKTFVTAGVFQNNINIFYWFTLFICFYFVFGFIFHSFVFIFVTVFFCIFWLHFVWDMMCVDNTWINIFYLHSSKTKKKMFLLHELQLANRFQN